MLNPTHKKVQKQKKNGDKDGKVLYKFMNNAIYGGKKMENLRNRIHVELVSNKKDYLKWTSEPSYMSHKIFDNDLFTIRKNVMLNKPGCVEMCILELSKVLMYELHYDCIKNKYGNNLRLLFRH